MNNEKIILIKKQQQATTTKKWNVERPSFSDPNGNIEEGIYFMTVS